uniref:Uncharacterized protein n=1 Tax=Anguilla anguilla TaxID=7936 RepID=A0A0E9R8J4_ANGAN
MLSSKIIQTDNKLFSGLDHKGQCVFTVLCVASVQTGIFIQRGQTG